MSKRLVQLAPALVFVAAAILYVATAAPGLTWAHDGAPGGGLVTAACTGGLAQPTGYPTYLLLGRLFALLPYGSPAWRLNLMSALAGAAAAALMAATARRLLGDEGEPWPSLLAAGLLATGGTFWAQSLIAGVHALSACCAALALYLAVRLAHEPSWRLFGVLGLTVGLGLGNEQTLLLLVPSLAMLAWPGLRRLPPAAWLYGLAGLAGGLAVYLYVPILAWQAPPVAWGAPETLRGFIWLVTGAGNRQLILALPPTALPERLASWARLWLGQFTWPGLALATVGLYSFWQDEPRLFAATGVGITFASLYALGYDAPQAHLYLLPAYLLAMLLVAEGARRLLAALERRLLALAWATAAMVLVVVALALNLPAVSLRQDRAAETYAQAALHDLPEDAIILSATEAHTSALWYAQFVLGQPHPPRWAVVDTRLLQYSWYRQELRRKHPDLALPDSMAAEPMQALLAANRKRRPVYLADPLPVPPPDLVETGMPLRR